MDQSFIDTSIKLFEFYKTLGEKAMAQVSDEQLFVQFNTESNSIGIIVNHLWGNMLSRWTDFLNSDGEKEWRNRDAEFENLINDRKTLMQHWDAGWNCLFEALQNLKASDLDRKIYIRNQGHSVIDAITRQLTHYAYHVGQIVFIAKMYTTNEWQTLSIAKGASENYNAEKFSKEKSEQHFANEFIENKKG